MTLVKEGFTKNKKKNEGKDHPKVARYIITRKRSLVALAGGENVYTDTDQGISSKHRRYEDQRTDIILRAAHALPDQVVEMFNEDFKTNDI